MAKPGRGVDCTVEGCVGGSPQPVGNQRKRCPRYLISSSMTLPPSRYTLQPPLTSGEVTGRGAADQRAPSTGQDIGRYHPPSTRRHGLYYSGPFCRQIRKLGLSEAVICPESHGTCVGIQTPSHLPPKPTQRTDEKLLLPSHPNPTSGGREKPLLWQRGQDLWGGEKGRLRAASLCP